MDRDLGELLNDYIQQEGLTSLEGDRGVSNLESIVEELGYDGRFQRSVLHDFLSDNPGAQQALYDWIVEQNLPEWCDAIASELDIGDEDEEDDNSDDDGLSPGEADAITLGERIE